MQDFLWSWHAESGTQLFRSKPDAVLPEPQRYVTYQDPPCTLHWGIYGP